MYIATNRKVVGSKCTIDELHFTNHSQTLQPSPQHSTHPHLAYNMSGSYLFKFPPEIRNQIYEYALYEDPTIEPSLRNRKWMPHPLSQTCLELRVECLPMFYSTNSFVGVIRDDYDVAFLIGWVRSLGVKYGRCIRRLKLRLEEQSAFGLAAIIYAIDVLLLSMKNCGLALDCLSFEVKRVQGSDDTSYFEDCWREAPGNRLSLASISLECGFRMWLYCAFKHPRASRIGLVLWPRSRERNEEHNKGNIYKVWRNMAYVDTYPILTIWSFMPKYWLDSFAIPRFLDYSFFGKRKFDRICRDNSSAVYERPQKKLRLNTGSTKGATPGVAMTSSNALGRMPAIDRTVTTIDAPIMMASGTHPSSTAGTDMDVDTTNVVSRCDSDSTDELAMLLAQLKL